MVATTTFPFALVEPFAMRESACISPNEVALTQLKRYGERVGNRERDRERGGETMNEV